jgi:hypothetical protein
MKLAKIVILEGTWWSNHEVPLVLPYFQALASSHRGIDVSHRTFRNASDIEHYVKKIKTGSGAFLYFACHGDQGHLVPANWRSKIPPEELYNALGGAKSDAVSFVHFGCCEMVTDGKRRESHQAVLDASGAIWTSGYVRTVDWLQSTFLDLALITEVFVPQSGIQDGRTKRLSAKAKAFLEDYEQLARQLGFSAMSKVTGGTKLFPERLRI